MNDTALLPPTAASAGFFSHSGGGYVHHDHGVRDLLLANQISSLGASIIAASQASSLAEIEATNRNGLLNLQSTERTSAETRLNIATTAAATQVAIERTLLEVEKAKQILERQAADYHGQVRLDICDLKFQTELTAAKNAAAIAAQVAECCCTQKALVLEVETRGIRDKLAECQSEMLQLSIGVKK